MINTFICLLVFFFESKIKTYAWTDVKTTKWKILMALREHWQKNLRKAPCRKNRLSISWTAELGVSRCDALLLGGRRRRKRGHQVPASLQQLFDSRAHWHPLWKVQAWHENAVGEVRPVRNPRRQRSALTEATLSSSLDANLSPTTTTLSLTRATISFFFVE